MKSYYSYIFLLSLALTFSSCQKEEAHIYVGKNNSDTENGTKEAPFLTMERALAEVGKIKQVDEKTPTTVHILEGEYYLSKPIVITPNLNGLKIQGEGPSIVTLKGSRELDLEWQKHNDDIFVTTVDSNLDFDQLFINSKKQTLARYPNYDEQGGYWQGHASDAIAPERIKSWSNPKGAFFHAMHRGKWGGFHFAIDGIDENGEAILSGGYQNNRPSKPHDTYRMVENVFEELNSPGEWYLDKTEQKLYYWPTAEVNLKSAKCEVAILDNLVTMKGSEDAPVKDVTIEGIKFEHTNRTFMREYEQLLRSDWSVFRGGAMFIEGAENCIVKACEFVNLGGNVVFVSGYNRDLTISENHIHDDGASAISFVGYSSSVRSPSFRYGQFVPVSEMDTVSGPKNNQYPKNCLVDNNLIYRIGRVEKQTAGVQIAMSMNITVRNNSIYDVPRAGINIGDGTWGGHILEYNDVFNTVLETGDHGSFNSWGRDRFWHPKRGVMDSLTTAHRSMVKWDAIETTIIHDNRFRCDHGWDIDLDDGSSNYHIYNNLCLNGGIKLREGFDRVVENNIMVNNGFHPHVWFANCEDVYTNNISMKAHQDVGLKSWGKNIENNYFTNEDALVLSQTKGVDLSSLFGDPLFIDPTTLNYTVKENSPVLKIGYENFPMDQFGVQIPELKALAKTPEIPEMKMDQAISGSFESLLWLGTKLKNVESKEEQSAYGLNDTNGVIVLKKMDRQANFLRLKTSDVILKIDGNDISSLDDIKKLDLDKIRGKKVKVHVMRNQALKTLN